MWFDTGKFKPSEEWLRHNKYVPDSVWIWRANRDGPGWARLDYFLEGKTNTAHPMHDALWAPIEVPDLPGESLREFVVKECKLQVVNITFGDMHIADEVDVEELRARVIGAVRKALGQDGKQQLLQNPDCRACRHYAENCYARWASGPKYGRHGCYEPRCIMNEQLPVSEWVSVDEETPIQDVRVWVYVCQRVVLGRFIGLYKDTQQVWEAEGFALLPQVTHWRAIVVPGAP